MARGLSALTLFLATSSLAFGQTKLTESEAKSVASCLEIIRDCQLPDGGFNMVDHGRELSAQVWIQPYFVNYAALALLVANDHTKNAEDVVRVGKWLEWCASHQDKGGFWCDHVGTLNAYKSTDTVDSHDSSAAMFLIVVERYQRAGGKLSDKVKSAVTASLKCIDEVMDTDGLTWAKPDYKVKYLMNNVEVYSGLKAAEKYVTALGDKFWAKALDKKAETIGRKLKSFWGASEKGRFAWVLHQSGKFEGGMDKLYPHGLAQLFGVAFIKDDASAFEEVAKTFAPQTTVEAAAGAERYLIAAARLGQKEKLDYWRAEVTKTASEFDAKTVYIFRPSLVVLALVDGADWMPSVVKGGK